MTVEYGGRLLRALRDADGEAVEPDGDGYCTLVADTYFFAIPLIRGAVPTGDERLVSLHIQTDADAVAVFTVEDSNMPELLVSDWNDDDVGGWVPEDPDGSYVAPVGTGWTIDGLELTKAAGAGGAMIHIGNLCSRRLRVRAVVSTGGKVRIATHGKV